MAYYRGDYYRGDYYRGDPFLGALIGKGIGLAARAIGRIGGAARARGITSDRITDVATGAGLGYSAGRGQGISLSPIGSLPGTGLVAPAGGRGKRPKDKASNQPRRMNPLNPRALRRALRRAEGFEKFAARTINGLYKVVDGRRVRTYKKKSK